jgi:hypothetical protein
MHPLSPNLSALSQDELNKKYSDLLSRLSTARRFGRPDMVQQLQMILEDYQFEMDKRNRAQIEEMEKNSKTFNKIIDIK